MREQEEIVAVRVGRGDALVAVAEQCPFRVRARRLGNGSRPGLHFVLHAVDRKQHGDRRGWLERQYRRFVGGEFRTFAHQGAVERRRLRLQIPADQRGVAIFLGAGIGRLELFQANEIERLGIQTPRRRAELGAIDRTGDLRSRGRVVDADRGVFRAAFGKADRNLRAVRRDEDIVDRIRLAAVRRHDLGDVDDLARALPIAHDQIVIVRAGRALLIEGAPAIFGVVLDEAEAAGEGADALAEIGAAGNGIENASGVGALRLHPVESLGTERFEIAVVVADLAAEEGFADRFGR